MWTGSDKDVMMLFREPTPLWEADPVDDEWQFFVLLTIDEENEQETGEISGIEILGFLEFDRWDAIPEYPVLWQVADWEPLPMGDLLQREQAVLRKRHLTVPQR